MGRILAIDYGTRRTGIAVSDPLRLIAGGLETVETKGLEAWLAKYFAREDVSTIVVGKPSFLRQRQYIDFLSLKLSAEKWRTLH